MGVALSFTSGWGVQAIGWAVQTLAVYFIPLVQNFILAVWIHHPETVAWEIAHYLFFAIVGLTLGVLVSQVLPASTESGRWVWAAPVGLMLFCAIAEIAAGHFDIISLWFGMGEAGWITMLVTWPAVGCCTYSAAMEWARRRRHRSIAREGLSAPVKTK